jgi:hypothetical protein
MTRFAPQSTFRQARRIVAIATLGLAAGTGCSWFRSSDTTADNEPIKPSTTQQTYSSSLQVPLALQPGHRPVVQDQLPLIYLVESNGTVRVSNVDTGEEIVSFPVKESQIVRVESKGVLLANRQVIGAQLSPGTYAIEMVPEGAPTVGVLQSSQTVTRAVPAAAAKPPTTKPADATLTTPTTSVPPAPK